MGHGYVWWAWHRTSCHHQHEGKPAVPTGWHQLRWQSKDSSWMPFCQDCSILVVHNRQIQGTLFGYWPKGYLLHARSTKFPQALWINISNIVCLCNRKTGGHQPSTVLPLLNHPRFSIFPGLYDLTTLGSARYQITTLRQGHGTLVPEGWGWRFVDIGNPGFPNQPTNGWNWEGYSLPCRLPELWRFNFQL